MKLSSIAILLLISSSAFAQSRFPFEIHRDPRGRLESIALSGGGESSLVTGRDLVDDVKQAYLDERVRQSQPGYTDDVVTPEGEVMRADSEETQRLFVDSRKSVFRQLRASDFDDPKLRAEFAKARVKLGGVSYFSLLAAPYTPNAFDTGKELSRLREAILAAGSAVLGSTPIFGLFSFLVDEHIESLESRREFFQNEALVMLDSSVGMSFSSEEKDLIRSSIFYSRLDIFDGKGREHARDSWTTYGRDRYAALNAKCGATNPPSTSPFGVCFKVEDRQLIDDAVPRSWISHRPSTAFQWDHPSSIRDHRRFLILAKLGSVFVPAPGIAKVAFRKWIDGYYVRQRRAEGLAYGQMRISGNDVMAQWMVYGSANPELHWR